MLLTPGRPGAVVGMAVLACLCTYYLVTELVVTQNRLKEAIQEGAMTQDRLKEVIQEGNEMKMGAKQTYV